MGQGFWLRAVIQIYLDCYFNGLQKRAKGSSLSLIVELHSPYTVCLSTSKRHMLVCSNLGVAANFIR